jgi:HK97 family phage major capsid protein
MARNQEALRELSALRDELGRLDESTPEGKEAKVRMQASLEGIAGKLTPTGRTGGDDREDADRERGESASSTRAVIGARLKRAPLTDEDRHLHKVNDDLLILSHVLRDEDDARVDVRTTDYYKRAMEDLPILRKSLDTGATGLDSWIPNVFSSSLHKQVRMQLRVAGLFRRIDMPNDPYTFPIEGDDATAYMVTEQGDADADLTAGNRVKSSFSDSSEDPNPGTLTLTSKKIGVRTTFSEEAREDVIVPVLPYLNEKIALAIANQEEDCDINGDTTGTHQDSDVTGSTDGRKAWKGLRKLAVSGAKVTNTCSDKSRIGLTDLRTLRVKMGKYGADVSQLVYAVGMAGAIKMLQVEDPMSATNPSPVITVDKLGPNATILTGQIAQIDGIPIILSPKMRENLSTTGVYDGVTTDRGLVMCVNVSQFMHGDRRATKLASQYVPVTDQTILVALRRVTFRGWFESDPAVAILRNVQI